MRFSRGRRLLVLDGLAALAVILVPQLSFVRPDSPPLMSVHWQWLLLIVTAAPLSLRRRWPVTVFLVVLALCGVGLLGGIGPAVALAPAYALYTVASTRNRSHRRTAVILGGMCLLGAALATIGGGRHSEGAREAPILFTVLVFGATWAVGAAVRERREATRVVIEQAAERARVEERLRIARDIHDVVTHSVGLIAVKAGIANHVAGSRPEQVRAALIEIEEVSRRALNDLRSTLTALRRPDDVAATDLRPIPGLADLPKLVDAAGDAGVDVDLRCDASDRIGPGLGLSTFRIVQEALTNVVRHAAPTRCRIRVTALDGRLRIEVTDDGPGLGRYPVAPGSGLGLVGMRERAAAHGGTLTAGPRADVGFQVLATLPL